MLVLSMAGCAPKERVILDNTAAQKIWISADGKKIYIVYETNQCQNGQAVTEIQHIIIEKDAVCRNPGAGVLSVIGSAANLVPALLF